MNGRLEFRLRTADCGLRASVLLLAMLQADVAAFASDPPDADILAAEAERVAVIERISRPTVAIFDSGGQGGGSGVIISPDGYALTNFHVAGPTGTGDEVLACPTAGSSMPCWSGSIRAATWP